MTVYDGMDAKSLRLIAQLKTGFERGIDRRNSNNPSSTQTELNSHTKTSHILSSIEITDVWFHTMVTLAWFNINQMLLTELKFFVYLV